MKKVGIVLVGIVILVGVIYCLPKEEKEVLIEEKENTNTSLAFYLEQEDGNYLESTSLPQTGYTLNTEKSVCTNNTTPVWKENKLYLNNLKDKGTSCYLYFKIYEPTAGEQIVSTLTISDERSGAITGPLTENTTGTIYRVPDDYGDSYVYAGAVDNNWVQFAGYYWRIIRINGDGSIRMIYNGTTTNQTGSDTHIEENSFNLSANDNAYVGSMYGIPVSNTYGETHMNTNDSNIKVILDNWYKTNIVDKNYSQFISTEQGFCNDRKVYTGPSWNGYGITGYSSNPTVYEATSRVMQWNNGTNSWRQDQNPTLKCSQSNDYFTTNKSSDGNKVLQYPIGLITADEAVLAGGFGGNNNESYYLHTGNQYWTMTPYNFFNSAAVMFRIYEAGFLGTWTSSYNSGIRPVINLKADVTLSGSGTSTDPYVVEGAA